MSVVASSVHMAVPDQDPGLDGVLSLPNQQEDPYDLDRLERSIAIYKDSAYHRELGQSGERTMRVAVGATPVLAYLGQMHDEFVSQPWIANGPVDIVGRAAEMPVDWKAWAVVMGTVAVKSAGACIIQAERFAQNPEQHVTLDPRERRLRNIRQRVGRAALTVGAGFFAYKAGQHASASHDMVTSLMSAASAFTGASYAKYRTKQILRRRHQDQSS